MTRSPQDSESIARERLREAVRQIPADPRLKAKVRQALAEPQFDIWAHSRLAALLAVSGLLVTFGPNLLQSTGLMPADALLRVGLEDHLDCVLHQGDEPIRAAPAAEYRDMKTSVAAGLSQEQQVVDFHECHHHGRTLTHLVIRGSNGLISLVVARRRLGDVVEARQAVLKNFNVSAAETKSHFIFLVSPVSSLEKATLLQSLIPGLRSAIEKVEGAETDPRASESKATRVMVQDDHAGTLSDPRATVLKLVRPSQQSPALVDLLSPIRWLWAIQWSAAHLIEHTLPD